MAKQVKLCPVPTDLVCLLELSPSHKRRFDADLVPEPLAYDLTVLNDETAISCGNLVAMCCGHLL
jgi:hypothetical protein